MAREALRVTGVNLCDGELIWTIPEVQTIKRHTVRNKIPQNAQGGRNTVAFVGNPSNVFEITFNVEYRDTFEKLNALLETMAPFTLYPAWLVDPITSYECIWPDPDELVEEWWHGYPRARYPVVVNWAEVIPGICGPVSS